MIFSYVIFFFCGLAFGYAVGSNAAFFVLLIPVVLALGAGLYEGFANVILVRLAVALVVTLVGLALGRLLQARLESASAG
jgi:hypothetical protein